MRLPQLDQQDTPEDTYQATFDTRADGWTDVYLPWHEFVPVKRAKVDPNGVPIDPSKIRTFGLVLSRFEFNGFPNANYRPGPFELRIEGGILAYTEVSDVRSRRCRCCGDSNSALMLKTMREHDLQPKPQLILVSSAAVERNANIGDDEEARKNDIPIVQLNPGGTSM